jgi:hypothetical protein
MVELARVFAEIQTGRERKKVVARTTEGEDRERLWSKIVEEEPSYAEYQSRTDRQIVSVHQQVGGRRSTDPARTG